jgi:hypothetical protein
VSPDASPEKEATKVENKGKKHDLPPAKPLGRHITALEKFELENHLRVVVGDLVQPIYHQLEEQRTYSLNITKE